MDEKLGKKSGDKKLLTDNVTPVVVGGDEQTPTTLTPTQSSNADNIKPVTVDGNYKGNSPIFNPVTGGYYQDANLAPVNAMMKGNACVAFNKNGNRLSNVSAAECSYLLTNVGMLSKVK